jgi:hypothetical protein
MKVHHYLSKPLTISNLVISVRSERKLIEVKTEKQKITEIYTNAEIEYLNFVPYKVTFYDNPIPEVFEVIS